MWLPTAARDSPLSERLHALEAKAQKYSPILLRAASKPGATLSSVLTEIEQESKGERRSDKGEDKDNVVADKADLSEEAINSAKLSDSFRQAVLDVSSVDVGTIAGRCNAIELCMNRHNVILVRLICKGEARIARVHPLTRTLLGFRSELGEYFGRCQAVDVASRAVPARLKDWRWTGPDGLHTKQMELFLDQRFTEMDAYNAPCGLYAMKEMGTLRIESSVIASSSQTAGSSRYAEVKPVDFYCSKLYLADYRDFMNRNFAAIGVPVTLPAAEAAHSLTLSSFLDEVYFPYLDRTLMLPTRQLQLRWLRYGHEHFVLFLSSARSELRRVIFASDYGESPARFCIGGLTPRDHACVRNLKKRLEQLDSILDAGEIYALLGVHNDDSPPIRPGYIPLISELEAELEGRKRKLPYHREGGHGGDDDDAASDRGEFIGRGGKGKGGKGDKGAKGGKGRGRGQGAGAGAGGWDNPGQGAPKGSQVGRWLWLKPHETLAMNSVVWDVKRIAADHRVPVKSRCWALLLSLKEEHNLLSLCGEDGAAHRDLRSAAHKPVNGIDPRDDGFRQKYSRKATDAEAAQLNKKLKEAGLLGRRRPTPSKPPFRRPAQP
jgi:hypothetical protein